MIAEKAVLGLMLKENYLITESGLAVSQFANPVHKMIFQSMKELRASGKTVDFITLLTAFSPQDLGGANYVKDLTNYAHIGKFDDHVGSMLDVWREREKQNVLQIAGQENWPIDRVVSALDALMDNRVSDHADIFDLLMDMYEDPFTEKAIEEGAPSGIGKLDEMMNRFQDGELVIVAARPSMGKSDVMLHIAKNAGWDGRLPIIFSLEMADTRTRRQENHPRPSQAKGWFAQKIKY